jgi:hypothetical protein
LSATAPSALGEDGRRALVGRQEGLEPELGDGHVDRGPEVAPREFSFRAALRAARRGIRLLSYVWLRPRDGPVSVLDACPLALDWLETQRRPGQA